MKYDEFLLQLLRRSSERNDARRDDDARSAPVVFVDLDRLVVTDSIDVVVPEAVVVLPLVSERALVPGPDELQ